VFPILLVFTYLLHVVVSVYMYVSYVLVSPFVQLCVLCKCPITI